MYRIRLKPLVPDSRGRPYDKKATMITTTKKFADTIIATQASSSEVISLKPPFAIRPPTHYYDVKSNKLRTTAHKNCACSLCLYAKHISRQTIVDSLSFEFQFPNITKFIGEARPGSPLLREIPKYLSDAPPLRSISSISHFGIARPQIGLPNLGFSLDIGPKAQESLDTTHSMLADIIDLFKGKGVPMMEAVTTLVSDFSTKPSPDQKQKQGFLSSIKTLLLGGSFPHELIEHLVGASSIVVFSATAIHYLYTNSKVSLGLALVSAVISVFYLSSNLLGDFIALISEYFKPRGQKETPSPQIDMGHVDDCITAIVSFMSLSVVKDSKDTDKIKEGLKQLTNFSRVKDNMSSILEMCIKAIEFVVNFVRDKFLGMHPLRFLQAKNLEVQQFLEENDKIFEAVDDKLFINNTNNMSKIQKQLGEAKRLERDVPRTKDYNTLMALVKQQIFLLDKIYKSMKVTCANYEGTRQEPASILLMGGPGSGKSMSLEHLNRALAPHIFTPADYEMYKINPTKYAANRISSNEFWDEFENSHAILYYDDFLQNKTVPGVPANEGDEIIHVINIFPMPLKMAHLELKGKQFMHTKIVAATTNALNIHSEAIISDGALRRRFDRVYIVTPKPEYLKMPEGGLNILDAKDLMTQKVDLSLLPIGVEGIPSLHPDFFHYHPANILGESPVVTGPPICFDEVAKGMIELERLKAKQFTQYRAECIKMGERSEGWEFKARPELGPSLRPLPIVMEAIDQIGDSEDDTPDEYREYFNWMDTVIADPDHDDHAEVMAKNGLFVMYCLRHSKNMGGEYFSPFSTRALKVFTKRFGPAALDRIADGSINSCRELIAAADDLMPPDRSHLSAIVFSQPLKPYFDKFKDCMLGVFKKLQQALSDLFNFGYEAYVHIFGKNNKFMKLFMTAVTTLATMRITIEICNWINEYFYPGTNEAVDRYQKLRVASTHDRAGFVRMFIDAELEKPVGNFYFLHVLSLEDMQEASDYFFAQLRDIYDHKKPLWEIKYGDMTFEEVQETLKATTAFQSISSRAKGATKHTSKSASEIKAKIMSSIPQMGFSNDSSGDAIMRKIIRLNMWRIKLQKDEACTEFQMNGFMLMVKGRVGLLPFHFIRHFEVLFDENPKYLDYELQMHKVHLDDSPARIMKFTIRDFINGAKSEYLDHNDLCCVSLPKKMQPCSDITSFFPDANDVNKTRQFFGHLYIPKEGNFEMRTAHIEVGRREMYVENEDMSYSVAHTYNVQTSSSEGDCGALLMVCNAQLPKAKVFGMHVAGFSAGSGLNYAISAAIYREDLEKCLALFEPEDKVSNDFEEATLIGNAFGNPNMETIKAVPQGPSSGGRTAIGRSDLELPWPVKEGIAVLRPVKRNGEMIDPFIKSVSGYCTEDVLIDQEKVDRVAGDIFDCLKSRASIARDIRIYTIHEAMYGIEGDEYFKCLPRNTSAGYPYNMQKFKGFSGKQAIMGVESKDFDAPLGKSFLKRIDECLTLMKAGKRPNFYYADNLKDETRPKEKVRDCKTRFISGSPADLSGLTRMYFGDFVAWLNSNKIGNESAVCVNVYSVETHIIVEELLQFGNDEPSIGAGDHSGFDKTQKTQLQNVFLTIAEMYYYNSTPEDRLIRSILWLEVVNSRHIRENLVYCWMSSLASGSYLTLASNDMYNRVVFRLAWMDIVGSKELTLFRSNVVLKVCGDDNLFSVSRKYRQVFNEATISRALKKYGITYTSETKGDCNEQLRYITEVSFLKRSFRFDNLIQRWVAPLELDSILNIPMWTKVRRADTIDIVRTNVDVSIKELALHGKETYDKYTPILTKSLDDAYGLHPVNTYWLNSFYEVVDSEFVIG